MSTAAADARPLRTVRRALLRTALIGALACAPTALLWAPDLALAVLAGVATVVGGSTLVEGWARGRGHLPGAFVGLAGLLLVPAAAMQAIYALLVLQGTAPAAAFERTLDFAPPPLGVLAIACLGGLGVGLAVRLRHGERETHGEVGKTLAILSLGTCCYAPVSLPLLGALVWGLAGLWVLADRVESRLWPLFDDERLTDLRLRLADGRLGLGRLRAAAWAGDPLARASLGGFAPSPPDELRSWVRGLTSFDPGALRAAATALGTLARDELSLLPARQALLDDPCGPWARRLEQAQDEAARAVGDGGDRVGPLDDAAVRAGWSAAFAAEALGEGPVRACVREAVAAWALEERPA